MSGFIEAPVPPVPPQWIPLCPLVGRQHTSPAATTSTAAMAQEGTSAWGGCWSSTLPTLFSGYWLLAWAAWIPSPAATAHWWALFERSSLHLGISRTQTHKCKQQMKLSSWPFRTSPYGDGRMNRTPFCESYSMSWVKCNSQPTRPSDRLQLPLLPPSSKMCTHLCINTTEGCTCFPLQHFNF